MDNNIKQIILREWNRSSGKRITAMLKKFWGVDKETKQDNLISATKEIFHGSK